MLLDLPVEVLGGVAERVGLRFLLGAPCQKAPQKRVSQREEDGPLVTNERSDRERRTEGDVGSSRLRGTKNPCGADAGEIKAASAPG